MPRVPLSARAGMMSGSGVPATGIIEQSACRARDAGRADGARVGAGVSLTARHRRAQRNRNRR